MKCARVLVALAVVAFVAAVPASSAGFGSYPQVGNGPGHLGVASGGGPTQMSNPRFSVAGMYWLMQTGVVVGSGKVIGLAGALNLQGQPSTAVVAVNERTGQVAWTAYVPNAFGSGLACSWGRPAIDEANGVVLVAEGNQLVGLNVASGNQLWSMPAQTGKYFVNVCPTVADGVAYVVDYVDITDHVSASTLYAVNVVTGQLLWTAGVGQTRGGCTPAVSAGKVMLATNQGEFLTFDTATHAAYPELTLDDAAYGFFGGVTAEGNSAYIVSFAFGKDKGPTMLYKIDISTAMPTVMWKAVAPRSDVMPVIAGNVVLVSGGDGYPKFSGTGYSIDWPSICAFDKSTGQFLWKTERAGGWTSQPVYANGLVYAVTQVGQYTGVTSSLYVLDISKAPDDPAFVVASTSQIGNSVAVANGNVYGTGPTNASLPSPSNLVAFGPAVRITGDINNDGYVNVGDLQLLVAAWGSQLTPPNNSNWNADADLNGDGYINVGDLQLLVANWGSN